MIFSIANETVSVSIKSKGAELSSYFNKKSKTEYVWQADPKYWAKHAPILFPVIGKVFGDKIKVNGINYPMVKHGFARDMEFELRHQSDNSIELALVSNEITKQSFPFDFELLVKYQLKGTMLTTQFVVENKGGEKMYFSIGGHPAFNCPVEKEDSLENCFIEFSEIEKDDKVLINADGFRNGVVVKDFMNETNKIALTQDLFKDDALIFLNLKSKKIAIKSNTGTKALRFSHEGFPHLGIWAPVGAPFVCIEPWNGVCDNEGYDGELKDRLGSVALEGNKKFTCSYSIEGIG